MQGHITTAMAIPNITQIVKRTFVVILALTCLVIGHLNLRSDARFETVYGLVRDVRSGRFLENDAQRVETFLSKYEQNMTVCLTSERKAVAFLKLYLGDLKSVDARNAHRDLEMLRREARSALISALRCNPNDGDLWVRMALMEHLLEPGSQQIDTYLQLSKLTEPNEPSTIRLRARFFPHEE